MAFILLVTAGVFTSASAQQHLVDSISKELQQPMADTNRAVSMMRLAIDYELVDTAKAYQAYRDALRFAKSKNLKYNLGRIYQNLSVLYGNGARYGEAIVCLDSAILNYQQSDNPKAKNMKPARIMISAGSIKRSTKQKNQ
ncbi:MAG: hypothetical protein IPP39_07555 [Chitinophagaceae bacterium]|nr:hypothetical protein [Chitinophagaceae bacterium]